MHEKYYKEIVKTINTQIRKQCPSLLAGNVSVFEWAEKHCPELVSQERSLDKELNNLWTDPETDASFEAFKAKTLAWGRIVLGIYKKFTEGKREKQINRP